MDGRNLKKSLVERKGRLKSLLKAAERSLYSTREESLRMMN